MLAQWTENHQDLVHFTIGALTAVVFSSLALWLDGSGNLAFANGVLASVLWFIAKEGTDQTAHDRLKKEGLGRLWHGWDWSDWVPGVFGGTMGAVGTVVAWFWVAQYIS